MGNLKYTLIASAIALSLGAASCNPGEASKPKGDILAANRDTTIKPGNDFFEYANGGWIKKTPIPGDEVEYGIGQLVQKELYEKLRHISEEADKKAEKAGSGQQIGDFWHSAMDSAGIEQAGLTPLKSELEKIGAAKTVADIMNVAAQMHAYGVGVLFSEGVGQDSKNSDVMAYNLNQGGLGMPIRDYYFNTDSNTLKVRNAYPVFLANMFKLMGVDEAGAKDKADKILKFETELARNSRKLEDLRDPYKNYNKYAISKLTDLGANINWADVFKTIGVHSVDSVIVGQPEFIKALDGLVKTTDMQVLKDYLTIHLVMQFAPQLSKAYVEENFNFNGRIMNGAKELKPRWKRALDVENNIIGEALGQLFVKEYFTPKAKQRYEQMVENVRNAYKARMEKLEWMSPETKQKAITKLMSITKKVGYPDKWKDLSSLKIERGSYVTNMISANKWWNTYYLNKLGKPVDRTEWDMTPQTYNAYYNPSNNEIVLPAAMMTVPGFRDEDLDDALVYGYTAASTVGHEITHGFDDEGRQFDPHGNLNNWWKPEDSAQFMQRAQVLINQFNQMRPLGDSLHVNGKATIGENLADLGGILIGLDAFKQTDAYKKGEKISGMTPLQRFFLGYSLGWMYNERTQKIAKQLLTDVHSPAKCRVNGPFPNVPEFYEAFGIKPGDKLYIAEDARVHLW